MKWLTFTFLTFVLILLLWATSDLPSRANPQSPANVHLSPEFTKLTETEIHVPNIVSAILAAFRGYDTLGETFVIFTAGLAVLLVLGSHGRKKKDPRKK